MAGMTVLVTQEGRVCPKGWFVQLSVLADAGFFPQSAISAEFSGALTNGVATQYTIPYTSTSPLPNATTRFTFANVAVGAYSVNVVCDGISGSTSGTVTNAMP